jgi:hypothetical protein
MKGVTSIDIDCSSFLAQQMVHRQTLFLGFRTAISTYQDYFSEFFNANVDSRTFFLEAFPSSSDEYLFGSCVNNSCIPLYGGFLENLSVYSDSSIFEVIGLTSLSGPQLSRFNQSFYTYEPISSSLILLVRNMERYIAADYCLMDRLELARSILHFWHWFLDEIEVSSIVSLGQCHYLYDIALLVAANDRGIDIYQLCQSPIADRWFLMTGFALQNPGSQPERIPTNLQSDCRIESYASSLMQSCDVKKVQRTLSSGTRYRVSVSQKKKFLLSSASSGASSPLNSLVSLKRCYDKLSYSLKGLSKFIETGQTVHLFFLHYQPEGSTIPGAGIYGDQRHAIRYILSQIAGESLLVKEHPAQFHDGPSEDPRHPYWKRPYRFRSPDFYQWIAAQQSCFLVDSAVPLSDISAEYNVTLWSLMGSSTLEAFSMGLNVRQLACSSPWPPLINMQPDCSRKQSAYRQSKLYQYFHEFTFEFIPHAFSSFAEPLNPECITPSLFRSLVSG